MKTDIEIAQEAKMLHIRDVADQLGIYEDELEFYGKYKAKLSDGLWERTRDNKDGKLVLVTAINPTPAGEGKTTTTVGIGEAMAKLGKKAAIALREPSLGPCFGIKGGAAGGGYAQVVPMEDLNLHFTGDFHAITSANNLLAANMLMNKPGYLFKQLDEFTKPADKDKVKNAMSHLQESMTDKESTQEAYGEMQEVFEDILEEAQYDDEIRYIDLKAIQSCRKQLTLAGNLAQEENYQIPVEINGERASIHLKVLHGAEGGKVKAAFSTESDGDIAAEFSIRNGKMSGYIACSTKEGTSRIQDKEDTLRAEFARNVESLARNEVELGSIGVIHSKELDLNSFAQEGSSNGTSVQTADLYQIAKVFITAITA